MESLTLEPPPVQPEPAGLIFADDLLDLLALDFAPPEDFDLADHLPVEPTSAADRQAWAEACAEAELEAAARELALQQARYDELVDELHELRSGRAFPDWPEAEVIAAAGYSALVRSAM